MLRTAALLDPVEAKMRESIAPASNFASLNPPQSVRLHGSGGYNKVQSIRRFWICCQEKKFEVDKEAFLVELPDVLQVPCLLSSSENDLLEAWQKLTVEKPAVTLADLRHSLRLGDLSSRAARLSRQPRLGQNDCAPPIAKATIIIRSQSHASC